MCTVFSGKPDKASEIAAVGVQEGVSNAKKSQKRQVFVSTSSVRGNKCRKTSHKIRTTFKKERKEKRNVSERLDEQAGYAGKNVENRVKSQKKRDKHFCGNKVFDNGVQIRHQQHCLIQTGSKNAAPGSQMRMAITVPCGLPGLGKEVHRGCGPRAPCGPTPPAWECAGGGAKGQGIHIG